MWASSHQYYGRGGSQGPRGRIDHARCTTGLHPHVDSAAVCVRQGGLHHTAFAESLRVVSGVRAHLLSEAPPGLDGLECQHLPSPCGTGESDRREPYRAATDDGHALTGQEGGLDEHAHVGDAGGLDQRGGLEAVLRTESLQHVLEGPTVLGFRDHELGVRPVEGKAKLAQALAVVEAPSPAGVALAAPRYLLGAHGVARLQVHDALPYLFDDAGELMPGDDRGRHHAGIDHVALVVFLVHVHVRATDPARPHPDPDLVSTHGGLGEIYYPEARVSPDEVAVAREAPLRVLGSRDVRSEERRVGKEC